MSLSTPKAATATVSRAYKPGVRSRSVGSKLATSAAGLRSRLGYTVGSLNNWKERFQTAYDLALHLLIREYRGQGLRVDVLSQNLNLVIAHSSHSLFRQELGQKRHLEPPLQFVVCCCMENYG